MKCVGMIEKYTIEGLPLVSPETAIRVSNDKAAELVATGKYAYVPKSVWKKHVRGEVKDAKTN